MSGRLILGPVLGGGSGLGGLADLLGGGLGGDALPSAPMRQPDATVDILREHLAALEKRHTLMPGDAVIYKFGLDPRNKAEWEQPLLLMGESPEEYPKEALHHRFGKADVIAMQLHQDGTACFFAVDRRWLEPWPRAGNPES